jgi:biopolymer transport protein ExbD
MEEQGLDLVPIMNLVTILIPFLLMSAQFVTLAVIDSSLPAIVSEPQQVEQEEEEEEKLELSILVTGEGYTISGSGTGLVLDEEDEASETSKKVACLELNCPTPDSYDYVGLTKRVVMLKDRFEEEENVILVPESTTRYEVIVRTMDAVRDDPEDKDEDSKARVLYPNVVIAGGVQ